MIEQSAICRPELLANFANIIIRDMINHFAKNTVCITATPAGEQYIIDQGSKWLIEDYDMKLEK